MLRHQVCERQEKRGFSFFFFFSVVKVVGRGLPPPCGKGSGHGPSWLCRGYCLGCIVLSVLCTAGVFSPKYGTVGYCFIFYGKELMSTKSFMFKVYFIYIYIYTRCKSHHDSQLVSSVITNSLYNFPRVQRPPGYDGMSNTEEYFCILSLTHPKVTLVGFS